MRASVVMSVYNGEKYVVESIQSILNQTYQDFEFIIINDGSTDGTRNILNQIYDHRVKIIQYDKNMGAAYRLNQAIEYSQGEWIFIQDADDISHSTRIEEQLKYIIQSKTNPVGVGSLVEIITEQNQLLIHHPIEYYWNSLDTFEAINKEKYRGCPLCHGSVTFSKKAFNQVGKYDTEYKIVYDMELWMRLLQIGRIEKVPKKLYRYRINSQSLSNRNWISTSNEMKLAACRHILELQKGIGNLDPQFLLLGNSKSINRYLQDVHPVSKLNIPFIINMKEWKSVQSAKEISVKQNIHAILLLKGKDDEKVINYLSHYGFIFNDNLFLLP